ncbi:MAG: hypothetical protein GPJ54_02265 [Candidatus Heimdallarchaeota archaeon]|nr:hypothetical protein [Candidatus Heimdallarchaeota archaeon]
MLTFLYVQQIIYKRHRIIQLLHWHSILHVPLMRDMLPSTWFIRVSRPDQDGIFILFNHRKIIREHPSRYYNLTSSSLRRIQEQKIATFLFTVCGLPFLLRDPAFGVFFITISGLRNRPSLTLFSHSSNINSIPTENYK